MKNINLAELDIFFISFDEPNCEEHWADLLNKVPWAKRVHGVYGSDAAHKECAKQSETERFITVDADNIINPEFFDQVLNFEDNQEFDIDRSVLSWSAKNHINGLVYGNGGIKCWPVDIVLNMKTHEIAEDEKSQVDFCWDIHYVQMNNIYSYVVNNATPYQAYRAGFREGVKMSLDEGLKVDPHAFEKSIWPKNYHRLLIWCSVGADVENGLWAIYGARLGCLMTNLTDWDYKLVRDFYWHTDYWNNSITPKFTGGSRKCIKTGYLWDEGALISEITLLGNELRDKLDMKIADLDETQSEFFKKVYVNPPRLGALVTEVASGWSGHGS